jgi:sarcosine oxidase, subunit gamma
MREMEWLPARGGSELLIDRQRLTVRRLGGLGQTLISGDLDAAIADLAPSAPMLGLYALAPESAHALRIGRQSALLVTPAPLAISEGWRAGWCATSVDDGWVAVEISGADAAQALMQATSTDLASGSASAAILVFGLRGLLVRISSGFRVHVEAPWLETLLTWLEGV